MEVLAVPGLTGFFFDDLEAIRRGAKLDGAIYIGKPVTTGYTAIRQKGESLSILLILENGQVAYGDCAANQYSGIGGRDQVFSAKDLAPVVEREIRPRLIRRELNFFKGMAEEVDGYKIGGQLLHSAIRYGVSLAILDAVAKAQKRTVTEVIADEYNLTISNKPLHILAQTGEERYTNVDKMILKSVDIIPHGLINSPELVGNNGEKLLEYVRWVRDRVLKFGEKDYKPTLHFDVYGTLGIIFQKDTKRVAEYISKLEEAAQPFDLWIETPVDMGSTEGQVMAFKGIKERLQQLGSKAKLVADDWCATFEDLKKFCDEEAADLINIKTMGMGSITNGIEGAIYCKKKGIGFFLSGTCNETDKNARIKAQLSLALQGDCVPAVPGMGVDEGVMINYNEMNRTLVLLMWKRLLDR